MRIIFCADYWDIQIPEPAYANEVRAAEETGLAWSLLDFEALSAQDRAARAVRRIEAGEGEEAAIYRGWMLRPQEYRLLYEALAERGLRLVNTPEAYQCCHYLPEVYPIIADHTPVTTWLKTDAHCSLEQLMTTLSPFGERAVIVKDFVKSRKHEWYEACYIPNAADPGSIERVVRRFLELQGENLAEGLVFREFVEFEPLTTHSKSGMPLTREYRAFLLDGRIMQVVPYWEEGTYVAEEMEELPLTMLEQVAGQIPSRFFTLDIARRLHGDWLIVEPGDAQVAGLPARSDVVAFYHELASLM